ncbi:MAG: hypothetical protein RR420_01455 [Anaerovoracaceae bacterium]
MNEGLKDTIKECGLAALKLGAITIGSFVIQNTMKKSMNDMTDCFKKKNGNKIKKEYLDILIEDDDENIRTEVAKQGHKLDILINDESSKVRAEVAKQGYKLDVLINDPEAEVRAEVAKQGYKLDILVNDQDATVKKAVINSKKYNEKKSVKEKSLKQKVKVAATGAATVVACAAAGCIVNTIQREGQKDVKELGTQAYNKIKNDMENIEEAM